MVIMTIVRFKLFEIRVSQTHMNFQKIFPSDRHVLYSKKKKYAKITKREIESPCMTSNSPES
jgi:hypothetical protein